MIASRGMGALAVGVPDEVLAKHDITRDGEGLYFRRDHYEPENPKDTWDIYLDCQEELKELGLQIDDPCVEHDCVSGNVIPLHVESFNE